MSWITQVAVGAGVVLLVVGSLLVLGRRGFFSPDGNGEETAEQREELSDAARSEDFRIPFRKRVSSWSGPYKVVVGSIALLAIVMAVVTYDFMRTGSPAQQYFTQEVRYALVGLVGIVGGVRLHSWFRDQIGSLYVQYERAGAENLVEKVEYAKTGVRRRNGVVTVPEVAESRLFGLFWRFRQVGEDRRLRGSDKPLGDVITHQIPDHGEELPEGDGWAVTTRADGDRILEGATSTADVTYGSPNSLSDERATQLREQARRKEAELSAVQATNAELYKQIRKMRKKIENEEYKDRTDLIEDFSDFSDMLSTKKVEVSELPRGDRNGHADRNGEEKEARP